MNDVKRRPKIGLVAGGLGAYWPQFPDLLPTLEKSSAYVSERIAGFDADIVDVGFISDAQDAAAAAEKLRGAGCDLIVGFLTTYMTATMLMPIAQRSGAPVLLINLQPTESMDHSTEMGHDGPAHLAISATKPLLRGLGVYHGKRGWGVSVEFDVAHGPVTLLGIGQDHDGRYSLVAAEGEVVDGPLMRIGNTTSRVDFGRDPGEWTDEWSASGVAHHWALGVGHRLGELRAVASLLDVSLVEV
jgi:L-arabinose isomerase